MPLAGTKSQYGKISKSNILTPPLPQGHVMSGKCEQTLDEFTVPSLVTVWPLKLYL